MVDNAAIPADQDIFNPEPDPLIDVAGIAEQARQRVRDQLRFAVRVDGQVPQPRADRLIPIPVEEENTGSELIISSAGVRLVQRTPIVKMSIAGFIESFLHASDPQFIGLLPAGTRIVQRNGEKTKFLIEIEPTIQNVGVVGSETRYQVSLPWQYFYLEFTKKGPNKAGIDWTFTDSRVFWMRTRFNEWNDPSYGLIARLPNIYQNSGKICFGTTAPDSTLPLHQRIEAVINDFFSSDSQFNGDLGWNFPNYYRSFKDWARDTRADGLCFLKWADFVEMRHPQRIQSLFSREIPKGFKGFNDFMYAIQKAGEPSFS